jgi:hypothetical protein
VSGSEIVEEWHGKKVSVQLAECGLLRGEEVRSDAVGLLLAVEHRSDPTAEGRVGIEPGEDSVPLFGFVPWAQIEMVIPFPGELP